MKKILNIIVIILFIGSLHSCSDAYNIVQEGELRESNAINTLSDMQDYLNGVYSTLGTEDEIAYSAIFTDECGTGLGSGGQNFDTHRFQINQGNAFAESIWYGQYQTINRCNRLIKSANLIKPDASTPEGASDLIIWNDMMSQTRAIRALAYFELLSYYSPDITNDSAPGVILYTNVPQISDDLPRSTTGEVAALIESDITFAADNIDTSVRILASDPIRYYISPNMLNAFRARFYLYRGNYTLAQQYAQEAINSNGALENPNPIPTSNPFVLTGVNSGTLNLAFWNSVGGLTTSNPYKKMWYDINFSESIFSLSRPVQNGWTDMGGYFNTNKSDATGSPFFEVGRKLFNLLRTAPTGQFDVRLFAVVDASSKVDKNYATNINYMNTDVLIIDKYPGKGGTAVLRNDIKVFRTSEMYLILAECYARTNNYNGAANSTAAMLKKLRDKRFALGNAAVSQPLPNYTSMTDALADILLERRKELCFEGHRLMDLKRLGPITNSSIDRDPTDDIIPGQPITLPITDYRFTLPIPFSELNANANCGQNPGY
ncbi:MAG: RagB/SusD family nutrient uptake outer membrane protein [Flavobacterium sp. BFFFF2]|nr:MAG: RagB/SusD family nutrient uptake outer membrane protein [Flavobacterium sp. BFFFF2]